MNQYSHVKSILHSDLLGLCLQLFLWPRTRRGHHTVFSFQVPLASSWLWQLLRLSWSGTLQMSLIWGLVLTFFSWSWVFERKNTQVKWHFHYILSTQQCWLLTLIIWLRKCWSDFSVKLDRVTVKFSFYSLFILHFLEGSHEVQSTRQERTVFFFLLEKGLWTIWNSPTGEVCLFTLSYLFSHLFISVWTHGYFILCVIKQYCLILLCKCSQLWPPGALLVGPCPSHTPGAVGFLSERVLTVCTTGCSTLILYTS